MNIRDAHSALATLLGNLAIIEPRPQKIVHAWKFVPPANQTIQLPCTVSTYELKPVVFGPALLKQQYTVHIQLFSGRADTQVDVGSEVASSFLEQLILALSDKVTLDGTVANIGALRGQTTETLARLEWGGQAYVGLDLFLDITMFQGANHQP